MEPVSEIRIRKEGIHFTQQMAEMNQMRRDEIMTDAVIKAENKEFKCHRLVMAAFSPYFRASFCDDFKEAQTGTIDVQHVISADIMEVIIDFAYTGMLHFKSSDLQALWRAGDYLCIKSVIQSCEQHMLDSLNTRNCLSVYAFAKNSEINSLRFKALDFLLDNFIEVFSRSESLTCNSQDLLDIIEEDRLKVKKEEYVYEAVLRWIQSDSERTNNISDVMECVRFPFLSENYLTCKVLVEPHLPHFRHLVEEAFMFMNQESRSTVITPRTKPRNAYADTFQVWICGGYEGISGVSSRLKLVHDIYSKPFGKRWIQKGHLGEPKSYFGCCMIGKTIYITGGRCNNGGISSHCLAFDTATSTWQRMAGMLQPRRLHACLVCDGSMYCIGGYDSETRGGGKTGEVYNHFSNRWVWIKDMPQSVGQVSASSFNRKIYTLSASKPVDPNIKETPLYEYDAESKEWTTKSPMPALGYGCCPVAYGGSLYVIGGERPQFLKYTPHTDTWLSLVPPENRHWMGKAVMLNNEILVLGGYNDNVVEVYDCNEETWFKENWVLPKNLYAFGLCVLHTPTAQLC